MKQESEFVSNYKSKETLQFIIRDIFYQLTELGECHIPVLLSNLSNISSSSSSSFNTIHLKLFPNIPNPPLVMDHHVPVLIKGKGNPSIKKLDYDLAVQRVKLFIDGVNYVKLISVLSGIDLLVVKMAIQHLL